MRYQVTAECVDSRTGKRLLPGEFFPDPTPAQLEHLLSIRAIKRLGDGEHAEVPVAVQPPAASTAPAKSAPAAAESAEHPATPAKSPRKAAAKR